MSHFEPLPRQDQAHSVGADPPAEKRGMVTTDGITISWGAIIVTGALLGGAVFVHGLLTKGKDGT